MLLVCLDLFKNPAWLVSCHCLVWIYCCFLVSEIWGNVGFCSKIQIPLHLVLYPSVLVSGFLKSWSAGEHPFQQMIVLARSAQQRSGTGDSVCHGIHFLWASSHHAASSCDSDEDQPAVLRQPLLGIYQLFTIITFPFFTFFSLSSCLLPFSRACSIWMCLSSVSWSLGCVN